MNSSINARLQRRLRKFAENPLSGLWVSGLSWVPGLKSRVLPSKFWASGPTFRISHKKTEGWYIEWQRMTTSGTTSNTEWYNKWQRITTSDNEWSFRLIFFFFNERGTYHFMKIVWDNKLIIFSSVCFSHLDKYLHEITN